MVMLWTYGRSWHLGKNVCRYAATVQQRIAGARLFARCAAGCPLPVPVSGFCLCSPVCPLRGWFPVAVCLTVVRAPMIANPFLTARLPVCQRVDIFLMLACTWERGCGRLDINQEIVVVSAFM